MLRVLGISSKGFIARLIPNKLCIVNKGVYYIREYGKLIAQKNEQSVKHDPDFCLIPQVAFLNLKKFIIENQAYSSEISNSFLYSVKKGIEIIQVKNYVGIIETCDGTIIEILPKVYLNHDECDKNKLISETKAVFLKMIKHLKDSPFAQIHSAHIDAMKFPLIEVFISSFINELEILIERGIKQSYIEEDANLKYFRGRLNIKENIRFNIANKARFYLQFDQFCMNIPQNRLIKSTLDYLHQRTKLHTNKVLINRLLSIFEEIPLSCHYEKDFAMISGQNRLYSHYTQVLQWAGVFLLNLSFINFKGKHLNKAILFPMEKVFEDYVASVLKKYSIYDNIEVQKSKHWLVDNHLQKRKFRLKPDVVCYENSSIRILDTKWKIIDQNVPQKNYLISEYDMYQLFAYGKKYIELDKTVTLYLLYPKTEVFDKPLDQFDFESSAGLILKAIPVDLTLSGKSLYKALNC